jgi:hypothetical protein
MRLSKQIPFLVEQKKEGIKSPLFLFAYRKENVLIVLAF